MLLNAQQIERRAWLRRHPNILSEIAKRTGYGRTMVSLVFNKHRPSLEGNIEDELRTLGAPGWVKKAARKA